LLEEKGFKSMPECW